MESNKLTPNILDSTKIIFDSGWKLSICTTGCNSNILSWLTLVPGASKCIVELRCPYSCGATIDILGETPKKWVSPEISQEFALSGLVSA